MRGKIRWLAIVMAALATTAPAPLDTCGAGPARACPPPTLGAEPWVDRVRPALGDVAAPLTPAEQRQLLQTTERAARRFDLDPMLVLAVIQVESRFDPRAVSQAGAVGLMQLRPSTAAAVADELGLSVGTRDALFEPRVNILLGTCYLGRLLERFGDADLALAAYNRGPTRISALHRARGAIPTGYVRRVRTALRELREASGSDPAATDGLS